MDMLGIVGKIRNPGVDSDRNPVELVELVGLIHVDSLIRLACSHVSLKIFFRVSFLSSLPGANLESGMGTFVRYDDGPPVVVA